jgi:octaprenyl-diphosphate synthase
LTLKLRLIILRRIRRGAPAAARLFNRSKRLDAVKAVVARPAGDVDALMGLAALDMAAVDALILERMQSPVHVIPALAEHLIAAGGKRLRPLLTVAAARLAEAEGSAHHKLAAAVEFIHTATLLHDDVVDGSQMRRGKVAAHLIWGSASSVLVGDFLFARAFELMVETGSLRALQILAHASGVIAEGEVLQLTRAHDVGLTQETYLAIISAKTAELFAAAAEAGAVAAGASQARVEALRAYGLNLGLAFQLVDDALDYGGQSEVLGKNAGDDFREGKATLPLILAVARATGREDGFWERAMGQSDRSEHDFRRARELVLGTGALQATLDLAGDYADRAKASLEAFPDGPWRSALEQLADFAVSRPA